MNSILSFMIGIILSYSGHSADLKYPMKVDLRFPATNNNTIQVNVFKNETVRVPLLLTYSYIREGLKTWKIPPPYYLGVENHARPGDHCPGLKNDRDREPYAQAACHMNLVINSLGLAVGQQISQQIIYHLKVKEVLGYNVKVPVTCRFNIIPHALSMRVIPTQVGTVGKKLILPLKNYVHYFDENRENNQSIELTLSPTDKSQLERLGLRFDLNTFSLIGIPRQAGVFSFALGVKNKFSVAAATPLNFTIRYEATETPRFKDNHVIPKAEIQQLYQLPLKELLEERFGSSPIYFSFASDRLPPSWLKINPLTRDKLEGTPPQEAAGSSITAYIVASSSTGGNSLPFKLTIPIGTDETKRPWIRPFELHEQAGQPVFADIAAHIENAQADSTLAVHLTEGPIHRENQQFWIMISDTAPTVLQGFIPNDVAGQQFSLELFASTQMGGSSIPIKVPLHVAADPDKTPFLKNDSPHLPYIKSSQPFFYDFVLERDVYPEFEQAPYTIDFSPDFIPPEWLKLVNNKLFAEHVPDNWQSDLRILLRICNIPGGCSTAIPLELTLFDSIKKNQMAKQGYSL